MFSRAKKLMKQGYAALANNKPEEALTLARELQQLHHTSAFEIGARAYWSLKQPEKAITLLTQGTQVAPQLPVLWEYLGCYHSDLGQYAEAQAALERGIECADGSAGILLYNLAMVFSRWKKFDDAIRTLDRIVPQESLGPPLPLILQVRAHAFLALGRFQDAITTATRGIEELDKVPDLAFGDKTSSDHELSRLYTILARAHWLGTQDTNAAREFAHNAIEACPQNPSPFRLLRDLAAATSPNAKRMTLLLIGKWHQPDSKGRPCGFYIRYTVLADTPEEALQFAAPFEPEEVRSSLAIDEWKEIPGPTNEPKGVCVIETGHILFPEGA
jgi:tetratricopeptide (TPR) repeat protein